MAGSASGDARVHYLRHDTQVDPLINSWYAWAQIIAPASAAFNVLNRQIRVMESFLRSPDLHVAALKNPALRGGPFIDLPPENRDFVERLLGRASAKSEHQSTFVKAVTELDLLLEAKAKGHCLQDLYAEIPDVLRGYVELYYDRHHRPDFRFFERMLYDGPLYDESEQSVMLQRFGGDGTRKFILTTPRMATPKSVELNVPFRSPAWDHLFRMRESPAPLDGIKAELGVRAADERAFDALFTPEPPPPREPYSGERPRVRYFGHACVLVEAGGRSVLVDPLISYEGDPSVPRFTFKDLPERLDCILITHGHHDHLVIETLLQLRHKVGEILVPPSVSGAIQDYSIAMLLRALGFTNVRELRDLDHVEVGPMTITSLPFLGEHHDLHVTSKACYHLRVGDRTILFAADSCNFGHGVYDRLRSRLGKVDVLFIGMECDGAPVSWVYGPIFTKKPERADDRSRRGRGSNFDEAMNLVSLFDCREVYVYAMGEEPWLQYVLDVHYTPESNPIVQSNELVATCSERNIRSERLFGRKEWLL